jgi:peptide chain release factor 2
VWDNPEAAQNLGKERATLEIVVRGIDSLENSLGDVQDIIELAAEESDESLL